MHSISIVGNQPTMTSLQLLDLINQQRAEFGEVEVRRNQFHDRVRDELEGENYQSFVVTNPNGTQSEAFHLSLDQCVLVAMRESKGVRRQVQAKLRDIPAPVMALPQDYIQALESLLASKKSEQLAIEQRDHAIATKAQIGSKREATAMATAATAKREAAKLKDQLGFSARHATILQVEDATGGDFGFLELRRWCKAHEVTPETVPDKRYPKGIKAWPAGAWMAVYGVDLAGLFGEAA